MEWMIDRDPVTDHRHTSHLFAVFPGSTISVEKLLSWPRPPVNRC